MTENNQISNWAEDLLTDGEEIIWTHSVAGENKKSTLSVVFFISGIAVLYYLTIAFLTFQIFLVSIVCIFVFIPVFSPNNKKYVATNERIILLEDNSKAAPISFYYHKIYRIKSTAQNIHIHNTPLNQYKTEKGRTIIIKKIPNTNKILDLLSEYWYPKSVYYQYISEIKYMAEMYGLELNEKLAHEKLVISVQGKLEGMAFDFNLNNLYYPTTFKIEIECPNQEKNSLLIKHENSSHYIGKLMGMQDIETGNEVFNRQYLLQSNNLTFFNHILDKKMIEDISGANRYLNGSFVIKEIRKRKKPKINSEKILDADMFDFYSDKLQKHENHISTLKYEVENMVQLTNNKLVMERSLKIFKAMINLGLAIKKY